MSAIYTLLKTNISAGVSDLTDQLGKLAHFYITGELKTDEYNELVSLARDNARADIRDADVSTDLRIRKLEERMDKLEAALEAGNITVPDLPAAEAGEYQAGKWYYNGDRVVYEGKTYRCTAPEGQVCVWSPAEYPVFWEAE